jgi:FkbM family methyltransferase
MSRCRLRQGGRSGPPFVREGFMMEETGFRRIDAIHPHWSGVLRLSTTGNAASHEGHDSRGTYELVGPQLTIFWDRHAPDVFLESAGVFVHRTLSKSAAEADHLSVVAIGGLPVKVNRVSAVVPDSSYEVWLRLRTSDVLVFGQVFLQRDYDSPDLPERAEVIVDLGGNVGYAAVFFGLRYPSAQLVVLEPESGNFAMLRENTAALGARVRPVRAAAWTHDGMVNLQTALPDGSPMGAWAFQVSDAPAPATTPCMTVQTLFDSHGFATVDILKIDIEGAELEVFTQAPAAVLRRARLIIVETHDRFRPGSEAAVRAALAADFEELPPTGENLLFRRRA